MGTLIQQIPLGDGENLYILDFNPENNLLTFRSSRVPEQRQEETIVFKDHIAFTNLYYFNSQFLTKFLNENT